MDRTLARHGIRWPPVPALGVLARPFRAIVRDPRARRRTLIALLAAAALVGGWLGLRDSPLVSVDHVRISGVHGPQAGDIEVALQDAGRRMTTLHVDVGALRTAVAPFRAVRSLHASTSFPHTLRIQVVEQLPVAALAAGGAHSAVAADGVVLGPDAVTSQTPTIDVARLPTQRLADRQALSELSILAAAPGPLARRAAHAYSGTTGLLVAMRNGPQIIFGDATRLHAKWLAAARVLADSGSAGATYIDVRLPDRPAAGGVGSSTPSAGQATATDPTAAALAAELAPAVDATAGVASAPGAAVATAPTPGAGTATGAPTGASPAGATGTATTTPAAPTTGSTSTGG